MSNFKIAILLSTYNGEKYISEQIQSILAQKNIESSLYVRDDGSSDSTTQILNFYSRNYPNIHIIEGKNIGCANSFFNLIASMETMEAEYFALCDQDDIWLPDKLYTAILSIKEYNSIPTLYCSNLNVVDQEMKYIRLMYPSNTTPCKSMCLLSNIATGCTCVLNKKLVELLCQRSFPKLAAMHDWWIYCMASYWGKVIFDNMAFINYRQHSDNVLGARSTSQISKFINILKSLRYSSKEHYREVQAKEFLELNSDFLSDKDYKDISQISNYRLSLISKLKLAFNNRIIKGYNLRLRIRILLGLI